MSFSMRIETPTATSVEIHTEHHRNPRENILCLSCKNPMSENPVRCRCCKIVRYCNQMCQQLHLGKHRERCEKFVRSKGTGSILIATASTPSHPSNNKSKSSNKGKTNGGRARAEAKSSSKAADSGAACSFCKTKSSSLRNCSKCKSVSYCDAECQRKHWSQHKKVCKELSSTESDPKSKLAPKLSEQAIQCSFCKKHNPDAKKCTRCRGVSYCNSDCQRKHWPEHQKTCGKISITDAPNKDSVNDGKRAIENESSTSGGDLQCYSCKKSNPNAKKCSKCQFASYCDAQCQRNHFSEHKKSCGNYPRFLEALTQANPHLAHLHERDVTELVYPPRLYASIELFKTPEDNKALLLEIVGPHQHFCRLGIYVRDVTGEVYHMMFHHATDEEILLLPSRLKQVVTQGNFIRWFHPRWHLFADGQIGFRIDSLFEMEFIRRKWEPFGF